MRSPTRADRVRAGARSAAAAGTRSGWPRSWCRPPARPTGRDDRRGVHVAMGVDADDVIDPLCRHVIHLPATGDRTNGGRPGRPRGETVMGHARTGGQASDEASGAAPGPTPASTNRHLQSRTRPPTGARSAWFRVRSATADAHPLRAAPDDSRTKSHSVVCDRRGRGPEPRRVLCPRIGLMVMAGRRMSRR